MKSLSGQLSLAVGRPNSSKKFGHYDFNEKHNGIGVKYRTMESKAMELGFRGVQYDRFI